jgi:lysozyme
MNRIEIATESIKLHEGWREQPYDDRTGVQVTLAPPSMLTIGWGRNLQAKPISQVVGNLMLQEDVAEAERAAFLAWGDAFTWADLSEERAAVIIEMAFQLGALGLRGFENFLDLARVGNWGWAADEMLDSKWAKTDSPNRAAALAGRFRHNRNPFA